MIPVNATFIYKTIMKGYMGTTVYPFIFYSKLIYNKLTEKQQLIFWNHENIHGAQQKELWLIGFYVLYYYYYFKNRKEGMTSKEAYRNNPFEMEANDHESNLKYLDNREKKAWKLYV